ncbi:hypothetical protein SAMN05216215_10333 [Saccharopolyspora shandongensis]|uniref:Uncharacterized protein n=1 Tax=Saccharopolyspora shandongensis TaxID=418495 RepID=A0A1H3M0U2_9PSEU|nr:hypothetical protein [Saccharopolyspora shandongensis]SDY70186.1 hypothetical protein SAMN05216215_10333 [Saccharopolyspora shandongensis]
MPPREAADARRLDLVAAADWYRLKLGWSVTFDAVHRRLTLRTGEAVDAVALPDWLATPVVQDLEHHLQAGPVCIDITKTWWTVLTDPCPRAHKNPAGSHAHAAGGARDLARQPSWTSGQ